MTDAGLTTCRVAIGIATYRREAGLSRALKAIDKLCFSHMSVSVTVLVIDNDASASAVEVCERLRPELNYALECAVEPRRGIPQARNAVIARAADRFDFIAFIDDDEAPDPRWLDQLLRIQAHTQADVVTGPVVTEFIGAPPAWVRKGRFFDRTRRNDGQRVDRAFTHNVLFRYELFRSQAVRFDERLALAGGSDTHLSRRIHRAGRKIVWADNAVVTEFVPPSRTTVKWLVRRAFRTGTSLSFCDRDIDATFTAIGGAIPKGLFWITRGLLELPFAFLFGFHHAVKRLQWIAFGLGRITGLAGYKYPEYQTTDGA